MLNTEKRIAVLEASASDAGMKIIVVEDGETPADALKCSGHLRDALGVLYCSHLDEML